MPLSAHVGLEARGRVAAGAGDADDHVLELLLAPRGGQGGALHGAHPGPDADRLQVAGDRLAHREVGRERVEVAGVEAVGVAGLGEELLGPRRIVGIAARRQRENSSVRGISEPVGCEKPSVSAWLSACRSMA